MAEIHEGGCLCGGVRYRVIGEPKIVAVCHCTLCKRRTGSAFGLSAYFDEAAVQITSGVLKTYEYRSDETIRGDQWSSAHLRNNRDMVSGGFSRRARDRRGNFL
jgi:hypothetical protein